MNIFKIIWFNLVLEWDGLFRILEYRPDKVHPLDIKLFINNYPKKRYMLNWIIWKIKK